MARPIILSNGELHVGLNGYATVHDLYYPYVGFENHSAGNNLRHRIGIWVDGEFSWLDEPNNLKNDWNFNFHYPHSALIGHIIAKNTKLGIVIEFDDFVDAHVSAFFRNIHVVNLRNYKREVRLFMHQAFAIGDSRSNTDTAQYLPGNHAVLHYRGRRAFVISGKCNDEPFDQHAIGIFDIEGKEGTYKDAEDGDLQENNVEHGRVDSTLRFKFNLEANSSNRVHYWIAAGMSTREAIHIHDQIQNDDAMNNLKNTADWWHDWFKPTFAVIDKVPKEHKNMFFQSMMIIKSQIDKRGAIIASTDTSMLNYSRDAYAYCWPRDGAFAIWPLIRLGYKDEAIRFFEFTKRGLHTDGYMMHKYRADGALGSSWHSYIHDDVIAPPIQEDETALPLFMFAQYYKLHQDANILREFYKSMVVPMADFMAGYIDRTTGLPKPTYDPWEEIFAIGTYTVATVYAALIAASDLATSAKDHDNAVKWRLAATDIQAAAHKHLYNKERKVFYKNIIVKDDGIVYNETVDCACVFGAYIFGLFAAESDEMISSIKTVEDVFGVNEGAIGIPRYENDYYRRTDSGVNGNFWFVTSLWLAQYYIDTSQHDKAMKILDWTRDNALSSGVLSEQINPVDNSVISPAPLTWSHAEYVATMLDLISAKKSE